MVVQCIDRNINGKSYDEKLVQGWINAVCEDVMTGLSELKKPFKYIGSCVVTASSWRPFVVAHSRRPAVTCVIMQNTGAGIHTEHAGWCDTVNDGMEAMSACVSHPVSCVCCEQGCVR